MTPALPVALNSPKGAFGKGHLPDLTVGADGKATEAVVAPRLKTGEVKGRSLMIHAGGDNYADVPEKLGDGGGRIACGVIKWLAAKRYLRMPFAQAGSFFFICSRQGAHPRPGNVPLW